MSPHVINFQALLPHMYGDINKLFQCFVELVFFYFLFAHNIYSKCHDLKEDLMGTKFFIIFVKYVVYDWG